MSNLIHNEQVKYAATFFNNTGIAALVSGLVVPTFSTVPVDLPLKAFVAASGIVVSLCLFMFSQRILGRLKE